MVVQFFQRHHRQIDVVFLETEQAAWIVHQHVRVEHEKLLHFERVGGRAALLAGAARAGCYCCGCAGGRVFRAWRARDDRLRFGSGRRNSRRLGLRTGGGNRLQQGGGLLRFASTRRCSLLGGCGRSRGGRRCRHGPQGGRGIGCVRHRRGDVRAAVIGRLCGFPNDRLFLRGGARRCGGFGLVFVRRQEIAELAGGGRQRHGFPRNNRVTFRAPPVAFCRCQFMCTQFASGGAHSV